MDKYRDMLADLNAKIWDYSEIRFQEHKSASEMVAVLKKEGFEVETGIAGIPTAYVATYGSGKPVIGILAEYDALSGLSQEADVFEKKPRAGTNCGHGCGHSLFGVASIGAALKVRDYLMENKISGTVKMFGCPGEEGGSGKAFMAREGVFDNIDAAITWHPFNTNGVLTGSFAANMQIYFRYKGISSHAAGSPQLGRSALDALELMNVGVNFLREHMDDTDRVHYAITNTGGISPNVVQAEAEAIYLVRSKNNEGVKDLYERVVKIAKGAAMMTETELEIQIDKACSEVMSNSVIEQVLYESMLKVGVPSYTEEEREYARNFAKTITEKDIKAESILKMVPNPDEIYQKLLEGPIADFIVPHQHGEMLLSGSSDVGDVSKVVPTAQISVTCYAVGTPGHSWQNVAQGKSSIAVKGMLMAADVMADATIRLMEDEKVLQAAKDEYNKKMGGKKYVSPIPPDVKPRIK